jgi:hypothetical protein
VPTLFVITVKLLLQLLAPFSGEGRTSKWEGLASSDRWIRLLLIVGRS